MQTAQVAFRSHLGDYLGGIYASDTQKTAFPFRSRYQSLVLMHPKRSHSLAFRPSAVGEIGERVRSNSVMIYQVRD